MLLLKCCSLISVSGLVGHLVSCSAASVLFAYIQRVYISKMFVLIVQFGCLNSLFICALPRPFCYTFRSSNSDKVSFLIGLQLLQFSKVT